MRAATGWRVAYWAFLGVFVLTAMLNMADVSAGFLTSYAADLFVPAWLYIVLRRLAGHGPSWNPILRWFGRSPEIAAGSLFIGSALTELSQIAWPQGFFAGTFDPLDLVAYGAGLFGCYFAEKLQLRRATAPSTSELPLQST
jgi:hypothetical protein